jgi:hypothetical protein
MKKLLLIGTAIICCAATHNESNCNLENIQERYSLNDTLNIWIENSDADLMYYYIGVELEKNGTWVAAIGDISNPNAIASKIRKLAAGEKLNLKYSVEQTFAKIPEPTHRYRLVVNHGKAVTALDATTYSKAFKIKK